MCSFPGLIRRMVVLVVGVGACSGCGVPVFEGGHYVLATFDGTTFQPIKLRLVVALYDSDNGWPWAKVVPVADVQRGIDYPIRMYLNFGMLGASYEAPGVYVFADGYWPGGVTKLWAGDLRGVPEEKQPRLLLEDSIPGLVPIPKGCEGVWQVVLLPQDQPCPLKGCPTNWAKNRVQIAREVGRAIREDRHLSAGEKTWAVDQLARALKAELEQYSYQTSTQPAKEQWQEDWHKEQIESYKEAIRVLDTPPAS